jgi:hypothetical protein
LTYRDGTVVHFDNVPGNQTLFDFLTSTPSDQGIDSIDFDDDEEATSPTLATQREPLHLVSHSLSESLWDPIDQTKTLPAISNPFLVELNQELVLARYRNIVSAFVSDLRESGHLDQVPPRSPPLMLTHQQQSNLSKDPLASRRRGEMGIKYDPKRAAQEVHSLSSPLSPDTPADHPAAREDDRGLRSGDAAREQRDRCHSGRPRQSPQRGHGAAADTHQPLLLLLTQLLRQTISSDRNAQPSAERVEKEGEAEKIFTTEVSAREEALVSI